MANPLNRLSAGVMGMVIAAAVTCGSCEDGAASPDPATQPPCNRLERESYLAEVDEAQAQAAPTIALGMTKLSEMRLLAAQEQLDSLLPSLAEPEQDRYRTRQAYYVAMQDYGDAWAEGSWDAYREDHDGLIDWDWTEATQAFMVQEDFRLPGLGVEIPEDLAGMSLDEICTFAAKVETIVGAEPGAYYQDLIDHVDDNAFYVLESMRKVKTVTKVLDHTVSLGFLVMDNIGAADQPPNEELGLFPITLVTGWALYDKDGDGEYLMDEPSESVIRDRVRNHYQDEDHFYVVDVEHWPLTGDAVEVEDSIRKLRLITTWMHDENPNLMLGYYRLLPRRNVNDAYQGPESEAYQDWQAHNDQIAAGLEDYVDVLFPSLYTLHLGHGQLTTEERWDIYGEANLAEGHRVSDGKPVIGYYALYYHPNGTDQDGFTTNPKGWEIIEPELMLHQLLTARGQSDAAVLYYDLGAGWTALQEANLAAALELFTQVRAEEKLDQLEAFMDTFMVDHHQELLDKLALEIEIRGLTNLHTLAIQDGNTAEADALASQILVLEGQLATAIDFWGAIQAAF